MNLEIDYLRSGGIITNYFCSSTCRHCLYACSPRWEKNYISESILYDIIHKIKELRCHSVHIGGLLDMAMQDYGFQPEAEYVSKCELCQDIRKYLILNRNVSASELQTVEFYRNL